MYMRATVLQLCKSIARESLDIVNVCIKILLNFIRWVNSLYLVLFFRVIIIYFNNDKKINNIHAEEGVFPPINYKLV